MESVSYLCSVICFQKFNYKISELILLFVKKSDGEGADFYCLGEVEILSGSMKQAYMPKSNEPVVHFTYRLKHHVEEALYRYLVGE